MAQVLIIDDHDTIREGLELLLRRRGHKTYSAEGGKRGLDLLSEYGADLVITDLKMAEVDGIEVLRRVRAKAPETDVMVITAFGTIENAVEAMKLGAADFITKPISSEEFAVKVDRLLRDRAEREGLRQENMALRIENASLKEETEARYGEIIGEAPIMHEVFKWVTRVARSESTVMIYGESGTGKELVARAIHAASGRKDGAFIRVNCGALSESLLDSELFGHEKGAFTGADRQRRGRFELANGGTLFLDEISTISPMTQIRLLRVLQERELERVGGEDTIPVDVRIVAATNTPADELLGNGDFREDLFYRLHVVPITLPPLKSRISDIPLLVDHFITKLRDRTRSPAEAMTQGAIEKLVGYSWPGNVRELENVIERALVLYRRHRHRCERSAIVRLGQRRPVRGRATASVGRTEPERRGRGYGRAAPSAGSRAGRRSEGRGREASGPQAQRPLLQAREVRDRGVTRRTSITRPAMVGGSLPARALLVLVLCLGAAFFCAESSWAQTGITLEERELDYSSARNAHQAALDARAAVQARYERALAEVEASRPTGDDVRYERALAAFHQRALEMQGSDRRVSETAAQQEQARRTYLVAVDDRLEELYQQIAQADPFQRTDIVSYITDLDNRVAELERVATVDVRSVPLPEIGFDPRDGPEELRAKADLLQRRGAQIEALVLDIDGQMQSLERRLRREQIRIDFMAGLTRFDDPQVPLGASGDPGTSDPEQPPPTGIPADSVAVPVEQLSLPERIEDLRELRALMLERRQEVEARAQMFLERIGGERV